MQCPAVRMAARTLVLLLLCVACTVVPALDHADECMAPLAGSAVTESCGSDRYGGPSVAAVLLWGSEFGIESTKLAEASNLTVRGLLAPQDIPAGTTVLKIPRKTTISLVQGQKSPFPRLVPQNVWQYLGE